MRVEAGTEKRGRGADVQAIITGGNETIERSVLWGKRIKGTALVIDRPT